MARLVGARFGIGFSGRRSVPWQLELSECRLTSPKRTFSSIAANGCFEPRVRDAAAYMKVCSARFADLGVGTDAPEPTFVMKYLNCV